MREAFNKLVEFCPPSLSELRANVVLLSGRVNDRFIVDPAEGLVDLETALLRLYAEGPERIITYSSLKGLRTHKSPDQTVPALSDGAQRLQKLSAKDAIEEARRERMRNAGGSPIAPAIGGYVNSPPAEPLREIITRVLTPSEKAFVLFSYPRLVEIAGENHAHLLPVLQNLPNLCQDQGHVVIFAAEMQNKIFDELYPADSTQRLFKLSIGGPSADEVEFALIQTEVRKRRSLFNPAERATIVPILEQMGRKAGSGLNTLVNNVLDDPRCVLNAEWAKANGSKGFDLTSINVDSIVQKLMDEIVGQTHVKAVIADSLRRLRAMGRNKKNARQPFMKFLFVGPSGVGKTEIAKLLCAELFGNEDALCRIDGNQFTESHQIAQLIGSPAGYSGSEQPSLLESHIQKWGSGLLLLDEFEKAHPAVRTFFLGILDEGKAIAARPSDSGEPIEMNFSNYIVLATSNAGAHSIDGDSSVVRSIQDRQVMYGKYLDEIFPPELLARFKNKLVFDRLSSDDFERMAKLYCSHQLISLKARCAELRIKDPKVLVDAELNRALAQTCKPAEGARGLRNIVEAFFEDMFIDKFLELDPKPESVEISVSDFRSWSTND